MRDGTQILTIYQKLESIQQKKKTELQDLELLLKEIIREETKNKEHNKHSEMYYYYEGRQEMAIKIQNYLKTYYE